MMKAYGQTARTVFVIDDDRVVRSTLRRLVGSLGLPREVRRRSRLAAGGDRPAAGTRRLGLCVPVVDAGNATCGRPFVAATGAVKFRGKQCSWQFRV